MTARTTLPFLILESGAASFTLAVTTSPRPARSPISPPRGSMQASFLAPELSATSSLVRMPTMFHSPSDQKPEPAPGSNRRVPPSPHSRFLAPFSNLARLDFHLLRPPHHLRQAPPFQLAQRPRFHDSHPVARLCQPFFIVRVKLGALGDNAAVERWGTRRLTSTTIVLAILVETTWPTFSARLPFG